MRLAASSSGTETMCPSRYADHGGVLLLHYEVRGGGAELRGEHAVVGAGRAAPLIVAGYGDAGLLAGHLLELAGYAVGYRGVAALLLGAAALLLAQDGVRVADGALGHGDDAEVAAGAAALLERLGDLLDVVGYLGYQDDVRARGYARVEREPAGVAAHELDEEDAGVAARGGVDVVYDVRADVHGALEAEGGVRAVDVVVYGLGQGDDVHAGVGEELRALLRAVAAHDDQAVEVEAVIGVQHGGHEVVALVVHYGLAGYVPLARGAEDGAALGEDAGEVALSMNL